MKNKRLNKENEKIEEMSQRLQELERLVAKIKVE